MARKVLITGINGQDGSYLAELLLAKGYAVHGIVRRLDRATPEQRLWRIAPVVERLTLHSASLERDASLEEVVAEVQPDECYHLAGRSFVGSSFNDAAATLDANIHGTLQLLSALRRHAPACRVCFAASGEMFGNADELPQVETTRFQPRTAYGISKLAAFHLVRNFRETFGMFCCSGILFNHESPRRGPEFLTRKTTRAVARIAAGDGAPLQLGNLDTRRDWGFAGDYVEAMWRMLQHERPDDYVIATNTSHAVRDFVAAAFAAAALDWREHVVIDQALCRPAEVVHLRGDFAKARRELGWEPRVDFAALVTMMVDADRAQLAND